MTKDEIKKDPGYLRLTIQQQLFVDAMMDNGADKIEAAFASYKCKDRYTAVTMASKCMRNLTITRLLDSYFGEKPSDRVPDRDELAAAAWDRAVNTEDENAALKWFMLVARVLKYHKGEEEAEPSPRKTAAEDAELIAELEKRGLQDANKPASE